MILVLVCINKEQKYRC